ncbi:hypothetical protein VS868_03245 [Salinimicrobium sp. 3283s]|uniref:hypothetical protein n=1 Tax=Salinimicrobium sp. 3283s TaxID=3114359 RepID=UPI0031EE616A
MELTARTHSLNNTFGKRVKDRQNKTQLELVYEAFKAKPMTMLEADRETGVMRSNICYFIDRLKAENKIAVRKIRRCSITGYPKVQELTANPDLFPQSNQLKLF